MSLAGRTALITGASQGLGAEIARQFAMAGASLMLCARSAGLLAEQKTRLEPSLAKGARIVTAVCDVAVRDQVDALFARLRSEFPRLDILVNNAGVYGPMGRVEDIDWDEWLEATRINLFGLVYACRSVMPQFRAQRYGKIINVSGGGATNPLPAITAYAASKAAVVRFTESLALECNTDGIDVNAVAPGALVTRMMDQLLQAGPDKVGRQLYERMSKIAKDGGTPLEIGAKLCVFLGSAASDGITGKLIAAQWDRWEDWPKHLDELNGSDLYTLRRITGRDRDKPWGDRVMNAHPGVAVIGCGLIGQKRAKALGDARLVACADIDMARAERLAATATGCRAVSDWREAVGDPAVSIVIVATLHDTLAEIAKGAVAAGKHVLVEKPAARRVAELAGLTELAAAGGRLVRVGFNHRYHRALRKAHELVTSGALGPLMFIRARYGHGARVGYDKEWRANPEISGGGELIDQGPHVIDLARWFLGDFTQVEGLAATFFWNMPVDDNGFLLLKTAGNQVAFLHVSCTEWKNTFSFEIYGRDGKIDINGLGGSYGTERLTFYRMRPEMGPPDTTSWEYPMADNSWEVEFAEFLEDIRLQRQPAAGIQDAIASLGVIEKIYRTSGYDHDA